MSLLNCDLWSLRNLVYQKLQVFWGQSKNLRLCCEIFFTVGMHLTEISVTNYNAECFFCKLWPLICLKTNSAKMKKSECFGIFGKNNFLDADENIFYVR